MSARRNGRMPPSSSFSKHIINFLYDPLGPLDARIDELVRPWAPLWRPDQVVCRLHVQARKNRCHDSEHALASLIYSGILLYFAYCSPSGTEMGGRIHGQSHNL